MKKSRIFKLVLMSVLFIPFGFKQRESNKELPLGNTLSFGGINVVIDMTDCSSDNSSDGKSRAIAAINSGSASAVTVQFNSMEPASGSYTTILEEPIGEGQVVVGAGGSVFGGAFVASAGQSVIVTHTGTKYAVLFKNISLTDPISKKAIGKGISGSFGCD